ncbi:MAG: hypothetical protein KC731_23345, partial [Myxococcales bacterium]|nr:hypothetical protein [Myxococcales bacterium]
PDSVTGDPSVGTRAPTVLPFGDAQSTPPPAANRQHPTWGLPFQPVASQPQAKRPNPPYYPRPPVDEEVTAAVSIPLPSAPSLAGSLAGSLPGSLPGPGQPLPGAGTVTLQTGAELAHVQVPGSNLSLTTYAALCATCGAFPARVAETYLKFGIADHEARRAIDEAWQAHFQRQPEARRLWQALFLKFRAWLVQYCGV